MTKKLWMNALQTIGEALDMHNLDREPGKIFITEASSEVGQTIASRLIQTGYAQVRIGAIAAWSSTIHKSVEGAEMVDFAWNREETYATALQGVKSVILTIPYRRHWYKYFSAFIKACQKANVKHYVKVSFYLSNIPGTRQIPFVKHHTNCDEMLMNMIVPDEEHVRQMSYTIISASHFMSNPIQHYQNKLQRSTNVNDSLTTTVWNASPKNRYGANYISPRDVAEAVTRVVLSPHDHYNRIYTILGPELISNDDLASLMTGYFGKRIKCIDCINMADYRHKLLESHSEIPLWYRKDQVALQQVMASGLEEHITKVLSNDFERICGHPPERFSDYLTYRCTNSTTTPTTNTGAMEPTMMMMMTTTMKSPSCVDGSCSNVELYHV